MCVHKTGAHRNCNSLGTYNDHLASASPRTAYLRKLLPSCDENHLLDSTPFDYDIEAGLMPSSDHKIARGHSPPLGARTTRDAYDRSRKEHLASEAVAVQPVQATNSS